MAKNLKLHIKNVQIAGAINLNGLKAKLSKKKGSEEEVLTGASVESAAVASTNIESVNIESAKPPKKTSTAKSKKIEEQPVETVPVKEIKAKESPVKTVEEKKSPLPVVEKPVEIKKEEVVVSKQPQPAAPVTIVEEKVSASPKSSEPKSPPKSSSSWRDVPPQRTHSQSSGFQSRENRPTGFQPREDRPIGFQPREERPTGFQPRRDDNRPSGFQPREDRPSGFQPRRDDNRPSGFQPREDRPSGFQPRRDDNRPSGFQPREDRPSGFQPRRDDNRPSGFQPRRDDNRPSGLQPREDRPAGFQPRRDDSRPSGFQPRRDDGRSSGFQPRRDDNRPSGFQPRREDGSGYPPRREEGFQPRRDDGRPPRPYGTTPRPPVDARRMAPFAKSPPQTPSGKSELMGDRRISDRKTFPSDTDSDSSLRRSKVKPKETRDTKPAKKGEIKDVDVRLRHGFKAADDEDQVWRKRRPTKQFRFVQEQEVIRPTKITVRLPISVKDLASEMKLKASELISKFFLQGIIVTLNDLLDDDTAVSLLGDAFGCEITIDTKEEERIRITDKTIREEIAANEADLCKARPPVIAFMGHVDHGKTSLVDYIRKSNVASHEVGAITQHIGSFTCHTSHGDITILDTPGHEAFSQMRGRGAEITDIVVLVIAGDEGMKEQTYEALAQATSSNATVVVAITKSDKPNFNVENVYRQLSEKSLLPEVWGGQTITINCSAVTGEGVQELLEMLALQADILELKANPDFRARGTVIESEVYKGLGPVATVLVQNGTLNIGDCLVFGYHWARVKAMRDDKGKEILKAGPSIPALINGLSGLPESGEEFIVVKNEKEAKEISQVRQEGRRQTSFQMKKRLSVEGMLEKAADVVVKKVLNLILRADVQGSVEALKNSIEKIQSKKVEVNIISAGVGEISESDVQLALASKAIVIGFHTSVESHVEPEIKELGVQVRLHDIIYHAVDDIKVLMRNLLEKIPQDSEKGKAEVKAVFKSSQLGLIAGCQVTEGVVARNSQVRLLRDGKVIWKGGIASLKRNKEDVREVQKGIECGILLQNFTDVQQGDVIEAFEVIYLTQDL